MKPDPQALVRKVLGNPELFPDEFRAWIKAQTDKFEPVRRVREGGAQNDLLIATVNDAKYVKRSGYTLVGADPSDDGYIKFDTYPQAGNWLYIETTGLGGPDNQAVMFVVPDNALFQVKDSHGNIIFDAGTGAAGNYGVDLYAGGTGSLQFTSELEYHDLSNHTTGVFRVVNCNLFDIQSDDTNITGNSLAIDVTNGGAEAVSIDAGHVDITTTGANGSGRGMEIQLAEFFLLETQKDLEFRAHNTNGSQAISLLSYSGNVGATAIAGDVTLAATGSFGSIRSTIGASGTWSVHDDSGQTIFEIDSLHNCTYWLRDTRSFWIKESGGTALFTVKQGSGIGFFGAAATAQPATPTTLADVIAALQALGLVA